MPPRHPSPPSRPAFLRNDKGPPGRRDDRPRDDRPARPRDDRPRDDRPRDDRSAFARPATPAPRTPVAPAFQRRDERDERVAERAPARRREVDDAGFQRPDNEQKVAGENACRALFMQRPDDIRRVYVSDEVLPRFKDVLRFCAERKLAYHVKTTEDLDQVADTVHHDGVLFLARKPKEPLLDDVFVWIDSLHDSDRAVVVLLEDVKNPHNLGAILRVCAHFGVPWVLRAGGTPALSPAVLRTAEGGAEHCSVVDVGDGTGLLQKLKDRGFAVLATSSHATVALGKDRLPPRTVVMFGSEGEGLSDELQALADDVIAIPGSGALESLNVACAASVVLWELWRGATLAANKAAAKSSPSSRQPERKPHAPNPRRWD